MKPEINFIKKLEAFFDDEFNDYTKSRIELYLKEFKQDIPPIIIKKEVIINKTLEPKNIQQDIKREAVYKVYATHQNLYNDAKELCELHQIDIDEFMNRKNLKAKSDIVDIRKKFCSIAFERYFCNTNMLAKFFKVHHSTISFYVHGKKFRRTISQTKKLLHT
jgi:hypothetical protein